MPLTFCFLVCENFFPEVKAAVQQRGFLYVEVRSFPSHCNSVPVRWAELTETIKSTPADLVVVFGSYCLRKLKIPQADVSRCHIRQQEQCHHLLLNPTLIDALQQNGTYLLSPGWLRRWRAHIEVWGFDRPTALEFFGESLRKLLLLDTGTDQDAQQHLAEFGAFLQLPVDTLPIGLEFLERTLAQCRAKYQKEELRQQKKDLERQAAESAMTLDLVRLVTRAKSRPEVISAILELFTMLFDPQKIHFIPVNGTKVLFDQAPDLTAEEQLQAEQFYACEERHILLDEELGTFLLRIGSKGEVKALLFVAQVSCPEYIHQYINTALAVSEICDLSIQHVQVLKELFTTSHLAGKAEVATEVLHNVGNTLNSISVASEQIRETVQKSSSTSLPEIVRLIQEHEHDLEHFCVHDSRGRMLPSYFAKLSEKLAEEREFLLAEASRQLHHIRRIAEIIRSQQETIKPTRFTEQFNLSSLLEESLDFFQDVLDKQGITVERHYECKQVMTGEPHKLLQVISNLIRNAVDAFNGISVEQRKIFLSTYSCADCNEVIIEVRDNGKGIQKNIIQQAFTFGFTTKKGGHGFGLHNAANLTAEMGGNLTGESAGLGQGATFRMRLPVIKKGGTK
ncbi:ATP-binding protein [Candidatus Electrothrix sp.]|uniref:ATP-binding protein n=1 Tax=Candidatus Electrothrix sp. TaxID=2170559 RepID=UPI0040578BED